MSQPAPGVGAGWIRRHQDKVFEAHQRGSAIDLVFVGDSLVQNFEYPHDRPGIDGPADEFAPLVGPHALNLGFSGDKTQQVLWRMEHGEIDGLAPRDIVLLIGINDVLSGSETGETIAAGIEALVEQMHDRIPAAHVTVLALLPMDSPPSQQQRAADVNAGVAAFVRHTHYARQLDLGTIFRGAHGLHQDLFADPALTPPRPALHPNREGQRRLARGVRAALRQPWLADENPKL